MNIEIALEEKSKAAAKFAKIKKSIENDHSLDIILKELAKPNNGYAIRTEEIEYNNFDKPDFIELKESIKEIKIKEDTECNRVYNK